MPNAALIEQAHYVGFTFVIVDTEHGLNDGYELEHHVRAADSVGIPVLIRIGENLDNSVLRALDAGAAGIVVPHVIDEEDAKQAVRRSHYPPAGTRGYAVSTRAGKYGTVDVPAYLEQAAQDTVVIAQVEDTDAAAKAETIARVPGINCVWVAPGDLSVSMGYPGESDHPEVRQVMEQAVASVLEAEHTAAAVLINTSEDIDKWRAMGVSIFLITATDLITMAARPLRTAMAALRQDTHAIKTKEGA